MPKYPVLQSWKRVDLRAGEKCEAACEWCESAMGFILDSQDKSRYFCSERCADLWLDAGPTGPWASLEETMRLRGMDEEVVSRERDRADWLRGLSQEGRK